MYYLCRIQELSWYTITYIYDFMGGIIKNISQRVLKKTNAMKKGREVTEIIVSREVILKNIKGVDQGIYRMMSY